jgi:carboxyl-terminal processing protease
VLGRILKHSLVFFVAILSAFLVSSLLRDLGMIKRQKALLATSFLNAGASGSTGLLEVKGQDSWQRAVVANNRFLFTDAVLSLTLNYYVEQQKVGWKKLIDGMIEELDKVSGLKSSKSKQSMVLSKGNMKRKIPMPSRYDYNEIVSFVVDVGGALEELEAIDKKTVGVYVVLNSILHRLDAHTTLLDASHYKELKEGTEGAFAGLGIVVGVREHLLRIIEVMKDSPAEKSGLQKDDAIVEVAGKKTYGEPLGEAVDLMKGHPGSKVTLTILRAGEKAPLKIAVTRKIINVQATEQDVIASSKNNYLYLRLKTFSAHTTEDLRKAIEQHKKKYGKLTGLVLDLRNNPGGLLSQAISASDLFLKSGTIVSTTGRYQEVEFAKQDQKDFVNFPMVTMINEESASAAEILAAALQENDRSLVIGRRSFGKGSVQTVFELPFEYALKLTIALYKTPSGRILQNVGVIPDLGLQPFYDMTENLNLLGFGRYRGEEFLAQRLDGNSDKTHGPILKTYYMQPNTPYSIQTDPEIQLAKRVLDSLGGKAGGRLAWLQRSKKVIAREFKTMGAQVERKLALNHKIHWEVHKDVNDVIEVEKVWVERGSVLPGEEFEVKYRLRNKSKNPATRVSVFLRAEEMLLGTNEELLGSIAPLAVKEGSIRYQIPRGVEAGKLAFNFGLAQDAEPITRHAHKLTVDLKKRSYSEVKTKYVLAAESKKKDGHLEPLEKAKIKVMIENSSSMDMKNIQVGLINMSGEQVVLDAKMQTIASLKGHQKKYVEIPISAAKSIASSKLSFGLVVDSEDLSEVYKKRVSLETSFDH